MTWAALLLADPSPCLRWLVLTRLLRRGKEDPEVNELAALKEEDPLYLQLAVRQAVDGSWGTGDIKGSPHNRLLTTSQVLLRLGYLGFNSSCAAVNRAAQYIFQQQLPNGGWPLPDRIVEPLGQETYDMIPLQTGLPLRGLAACGYAEHPQAEEAYEWLLNVQLEDGAWPTGTASGTWGGVAGYRRMPNSRWGCRTNTTAVPYAAWLCTPNDATARLHSAPWTCSWGGNHRKRPTSASKWRAWSVQNLSVGS